MKLTTYTDYSLRTLIYLAALNEERLCNIQEISTAYGISKNHLMKVVHHLGKLGIIETIRGRNGGFRLAKKPEDINIGKLIRQTEEDFYLVECFNPDNPNPCVITPICGLTHMLREALQAYLQVLDKYTLADIVKRPESYRALLFNEQ